MLAINLKLAAVIVMPQEFRLNKKDISVVVHDFLSRKVLVSAMATEKQLLGLSLRTLYPMTSSINDSQCAWKNSRTISHFQLLFRRWPLY